MKRKVIIHADDYGISVNVSKSVAKQIGKGAIQSVSIMPNMEATEDGVTRLMPFADRVLVSVHLNLVEGRCVADSALIPLLVDSAGFLKLSWLQIMMKSVRKTFRQQAAIEFKAQIRRTEALLKGVGFTGKIRIDSHQHVHMIPGIFKTVCSLLSDFDVEYIRLTREPLLPYIKETGLWKTYNIVNIAKNILLNLFAIPDRHMLSLFGLKYNYFFGLLITGNMDYERVCRLIPRMPERHVLEVVLHAGRMLESEITEEFNKKDFVKEHTSSRRLLELETVARLFKVSG